jgi:hypothetical protein
VGPHWERELRCVSEVVEVTREVSTTAAASASLPAPCVMQPRPTPRSTVSHPSRKAREQWGAHCVWRCQRDQQPGSLRWGRRDTQEVRRRRADCARPFASALLSRGTCEMENFSDRANFWQVQCSE